MTQSSQGVSRCLTDSPGEAVKEAVKSEWWAVVSVTRTVLKWWPNRSASAGSALDLSSDDRDRSPGLVAGVNLAAFSVA
jgi:hypothetical protein